MDPFSEPTFCALSPGGGVMPAFARLHELLPWFLEQLQKSDQKMTENAK